MMTASDYFHEIFQTVMEIQHGQEILTRGQNSEIESPSIVFLTVDILSHENKCIYKVIQTVKKKFSHRDYP